MPKKSSASSAFAPRAIDLVTRAEAQHILGDISSATLYRGVASGRFPAPVKVGPNTSRWNRAKLEACVEQFEGQASAHCLGATVGASLEEQPLSCRK